MNRYNYDISGWPVLLVTVPPEPTTASEFQGHLDKLATFLERGRLGLIIDARGANSLTASERRTIAEWLDQSAARYPGRLACLGLVVSSPVQRGIFKAISWLTKASFERAAFAELESAKKWAYACARVSVQPSAAVP